MKRTERHHLKENEVAEWVLSLKEQLEQNRQAITYGSIAVVVVIIAVLGTLAWRAVSANRSNALLAEAMTVAEAPVTNPVAAGEGQLPTQPAGTYPSERARHEAALPKLLAAADAYPATEAGFIARYRAGAALAALGRVDEAVRQYRTVADRATGVVQSMARLGIADAEAAAGKYDDAVKALKDLSTATNLDVPADGVLMQLARVYRLAGKAADAKQTFQRVLAEFPQSVYASEARRELESL